MSSVPTTGYRAGHAKGQRAMSGSNTSDTRNSSAPKKTPATKKRRGGRPSQRAEILDAAVALFSKGGSRGTPLAAIAHKIGVTVPAITHHFGSKHALLMEVVGVTDRIDELRMTPTTPMTGLDRVSGLRSWALQLTSDPGLANLSRLSVVMTGEALDVDFAAHHHFVNRFRRFRQLQTKTISAGQADGSIRKDVDPLTVATEILSFIQGAGLYWFLDPHSIDLVTVYDRYFDRLVRDLAAKPSSRRERRTKA